MDFYKVFYAKIQEITNQIATEKGLDASSFPNYVVESPKNEDHGDISTNVAMILCKRFGTNPMQLAELYKQKIEELDFVASVEIAKPAFINIIFKNTYWHKFLSDLLAQKENFGKSDIGKGLRVNVEYVSANPTGPLHVGHGRGAVLGDIISSIYEFFGYDVTREYYVNDAGGQIDVLSNSLYYRYAEELNALGNLNALDGLEKGENFYPGEYLVTTAKKIVAKDGDAWLSKPELERIEFFKNYATDEMLEIIKEGLAILGIKHDVFSSEKTIATNEHYNAIIAELTKRDIVYTGVLPAPKGAKNLENFEAREQKLFRSTAFGDDIDRALEKSNGERTYFANDMVYHADKVERGFDKLIDVLGADHIGYIKRIESAVLALSNSKVGLEGVFCQLVNLLDDGKPLRMSKRAGNFITLSDLVNAVGKDIFRFMMITRKNDVSIDLDVNIANQQTLDNPVFYIQYAYARISSVLENAKNTMNISEEALKEKLKEADFNLLADPKELKLLKSMLKLPKFAESALQNNDPHKIYLYLMEVSSSFHTLWNAGKEDGGLRFIIENNEKLTISRLSLIMAASICIKNMLSLLGVNIKEKM